MRLSLLVVPLSLSIAVPAAAGPDLNGTWEVQSMGGDREVKIKVKGNKLVAHRVLWPEFEGERYKLEHRYRGKISGNTIRGEMQVREEGVGQFEVLRPFTGSIDSESRITLDGLPMKRVGGAAAAAPAPQPTPERVLPPPPRPPPRPSDLPGFP